jgi:hypothetical protein
VRTGVFDPATRSFYAGLLFIGALACVGLAPAISGPWILDDGPLISTNARIQTLSAANVRFLLTHDMWDLDLSSARVGTNLIYARPLVMLSYAVDWQLGGGSSVMFHVTNALLHLLTIFLAGRALLRWSGIPAGALLATAYFALHPARAESAAWISGRPDVLATLGLLVCVEGVHALHNAARIRAITLFVLGVVVSFGAKETAVLLPLLVMIELATATRRGALKPDGRAWPLIVSLAIAGCYLVARQVWLPMRPFPITGLGLVTHLGFVFETLGRAAMFLLAPFDLSLSGPMLTERGGKVAPEMHYVLLGAISFLVLLTALVWTRRRKPRAFWSLVAFLISLLPTLNIVWIGGIGSTASRFFYLPSLLLAWFAVELGKGRFQSVTPRVTTLSTYAGAVVLTLLFALQSLNFRSEDHFWASELRSRPDVPANIEYFIRRDWARGEPDRALARSFCSYQFAAQRFSFIGEGARIILMTLAEWAKLLPDARPGELGAIADFLAAAREPNGPAVLQLGLALEVPPQSKVRKTLVRRAAETQTQEAEIRVRLGEPARALELLRAARTGCPRCHDLLDRQARVAYQALDADFAEELAQASLEEHWGELTKRAALERLRGLNHYIAQATGTKLVQLEVQRFAELGLYGEGLRRLDQARRDAPDAANDQGLLRLMLTFAARAGDRPLTVRLANELEMPPPPLPPELSLDRTNQYLAQLQDGCAFPDDLE